MRPVLFLTLVLAMASSAFAQEYGAGSFFWRVAVPLTKAGFLPDTISTDLHTYSMNAGLKDMMNLMSKFLASPSSARRPDRESPRSPSPITGARATRAGTRTMPSRREHGRRRDSSLQSVENYAITAISGGIARRSGSKSHRSYSRTADARRA